MSIITVTEAKTYLQLPAGSTYDALIAALIPEAEAQFLKIRSIPFYEIEADIVSGSNEITDISDEDILRVEENDYLEAAGIVVSSIVNKVENWKSERVNITENKIIIDNDATASTENLLIKVYPKGSKFATSKIIGYYMDKSTGTGVKSESIGSYSYTTDQNMAGLPESITKFIVQYMSGYC